MSVSNQVRTVIELFCRILEENRVSCVRAETLRQAKFNKDLATQQLWRLLFEVTCFLDSDMICQGHSHPPQLSQEEEMIYVKSELQKWGYLSQSFATLSPEVSSGSREVLLALGWVIHTQRLFDKIIARRSSPLQQDLIQFVNLDPVPEQAPGILLQDSENENMSPKDKIQFQLMLCGKFRMSLRRLHTVCQQLAVLKLTIKQSTKGVSLQSDLNHLTPLEVYLLKYPSALKKMLGELERDSEQLKNLLDWRDKEHIFWEWMESVLSLHIEDNKGRSSPEDALDEVEEVYLPIPESIGKEIYAARSKLRDFILSHEDDMERMEQLIHRKKVTSVETEISARRMDNELTQLSQKLRLCGRGFNPPHDNKKTSHSAENSLVPDTPHLAFEYHPNPSPKLMQSAQAIKARKDATILEAAKMEIMKLKAKVEKLEKELKELQVKNLHKLQGATDQYPNLICVQPRYCKQLYMT